MSHSASSTSKISRTSSGQFSAKPTVGIIKEKFCYVDAIAEAICKVPLIVLDDLLNFICF